MGSPEGIDPVEGVRTTSTSLPGDRPRRRLHTVRATAALSVLAPLACLPYLATTWPAGHRPAMVAICAVMMLLAGPAFLRADAIERSRSRVAVQLTGLSLNVVGFAVLGWLDGGVNSTLGAVLPLLVILLALGMPLRPFLAVAALGAA